MMTPIIFAHTGIVLPKCDTVILKAAISTIRRANSVMNIAAKIDRFDIRFSLSDGVYYTKKHVD